MTFALGAAGCHGQMQKQGLNQQCKRADLIQRFVSAGLGAELRFILLPLTSSLLQGNLDAVPQLLQGVLQVPNLHITINKYPTSSNNRPEERLVLVIQDMMYGTMPPGGQCSGIDLKMETRKQDSKLHVTVLTLIPSPMATNCYAGVTA